MGCAESTILDYTVQYCNLEPVSGQENTFKIILIGEDSFPKLENVKFINQIQKTNNPEITKFLERPNLQTNTIFYYYLREEPLIKTFNQSTKYVPYNLQNLSKVILLSTDSVTQFPSQVIENETKHLDQKKFINYVLNLNEDKKLLDQANNPNITKDNLSLNEHSFAAEDESVKEKEGEIIISEDVTKDTYRDLVSKFENGGVENSLQNNINLETSDDNHIPKNNGNNNHNIKSVKIYGAKFDDMDIFIKIMNYLSKKDIKKFSFFENNTNSDFDGWDAISDFFDSNFALRYIDLHGSNLYDYHLSPITRALTNKRIRYLNLSENFLTIDGIEIIASYLKHNKTLQKLNLCRNAQCQFKAEGVKLITDALMSNPNILLLDVSYMNLTGCGEAIGNFITNSKSIENICLRNVQLNAIDFKNIFIPLKTNKVLKEIDISMNDMGGDKSLQYIADTIKENKTLVCIRMDQININNDNYQIIFDAIEKNRNIISYSVSFNSKIKPKIMLNFFIKQKHVKHLEYEPFDKENPEDKKKELTLEEKKLFEKFKTERPDMELIYK